MGRFVRNQVRRFAAAVCVFFATLVVASGLSGCVVAGYSSRGGAFVWPGGFGLILIVLLVLFLLRRR